jgi:hypothetical protein
MNRREQFSLLESCVRAALAGNKQLLSCNISKAVELVRYGKDDTLRIDMGPEKAIRKVLEPIGVVVTEEKQKKKGRTYKGLVTFFVDPTDGSTQLKNFAMACHDQSSTQKMSDILGVDESVQAWGCVHGMPTSVTGACLAITCVADSRLVGTVIVNYITQEIFTASREGIYRLPIPQDGNLSYREVVSEKKTVDFYPLRGRVHGEYEKLTGMTYAGVGKSGYEMNLASSLILKGEGRCVLVAKSPNGPGRPLFLSSLHFDPIVGFIFSNGEKITEWIHWLSFVIFAKSEDGTQTLNVFEVLPLEIVHLIDGIPLQQGPDHSLFQRSGSRHVLDIKNLLRLAHPHRFRSTLVVAPNDNERIPKMLIGRLRPLQLT